MSMLIVNTKNARLFKDLRTFGMMCPYVTIECGSFSTRTETHNAGGMNPEWNQFFTFDTDGDQVTFSIWDEGSIYDSKIGTYTLNISDLQKDVVFENWMNLVYDGESIGELFVEITYVNKQDYHHHPGSLTPTTPQAIHSNVTPSQPPQPEMITTPYNPTPTPSPSLYPTPSPSPYPTPSPMPSYPAFNPTPAPAPVPAQSPFSPPFPSAYVPQPTPAAPVHMQPPGYAPAPQMPAGYAGPTFTPIGSNVTYSLNSAYQQHN